jgi:hypothetical protein
LQHLFQRDLLHHHRGELYLLLSEKHWAAMTLTAACAATLQLNLESL